MSNSSIIVGISGASGAIYGVTALKMLRAAGISTHAVVSRSGELTLRSECGMGLKDVESLCDVLHPIGNVGASIASGSFPSLGMLVAPCSIRSLSEIVHGVTSTLLTRAADVALKERRRLVLMVRETPLHLGHLRSMTAAAEMGATILPPVPAFYTAPTSIDNIVSHSVGRAIDQFGLTLEIPRWSGMQNAGIVRKT